MPLKMKERELECGKRSYIMGILNVTPDSFSDGGNFFDPQAAVNHALQMIEDGADIIDVGGESTRPGAKELTCTEEISRVVPVIEKLRSACPDCIISIDTRKGDVARAAVLAGADIINDISGLQFCSEIAKVAAQTGAGLILMHMRGTPETMQSVDNLEYSDVVCVVYTFLSEAIDKAVKAGVKRNQIAIDPGIGFSKNCEQNIAILNRISVFKDLKVPVLIGHSRKSFIGQILEESNPAGRIFGTAGVTAWLAMNNTDIIRVHDVKEMKQTLMLFDACRNGITN